MDHESFDRLTKVFVALGTRRSALGALLGLGIAGTASVTDAAKKGKGKKKDRKKDRKKAPAPSPAAAVEAPSIEAEAVVCEPPSDGANMSGCNYNNRNLARFDLSGSRMVGTLFRGANLCGANLSSSQLKNANFRGFSAGNKTNLTLADLHSSGCVGTLDNEHTFYCHTRTCSGAISSRDCPSVDHACCDASDCEGSQVCSGNACVCLATCCVDDDCDDLRPGIVITLPPILGGGTITLGAIPQICDSGDCCVGGGVFIGPNPGGGNIALCNFLASQGFPCLPGSVCCSGTTSGGIGLGRQCTAP